jgi:hypothetical protein
MIRTWFLFLEFGSFVFYFFINDLALNDMTLILGIDMNARVLIETHVMYDKLFILTKKWSSDIFKI